MTKSPTKTAGKKTPAPRAKKTITADTRESLIASMGTLLDEVDAVLPTLTTMNWQYGMSGPLAKLRETMGQLSQRMWKVLEDTDDSAPDVFFRSLMTTPGTVPTVAQPGLFVEWIGYVPILIQWGGFLQAGTSDLRMIDPAEKWINSTGYQSVRPLVTVGVRDVRALLRAELVKLTLVKDFTLHDVSAQNRDSVIETLAVHEWLRTAIERGPVDPIPLPAKLRAVQQTLFV